MVKWVTRKLGIVSPHNCPPATLPALWASRKECVHFWDLGLQHLLKSLLPLEERGRYKSIFFALKLTYSLSKVKN